MNVRATRLLNVLRAAGRPLSRAELESVLSYRPNTVRTAVCDLRAAGIHVFTSPHPDGRGQGLMYALSVKQADVTRRDADVAQRAREKHWRAREARDAVRRRLRAAAATEPEVVFKQARLRHRADHPWRRPGGAR